LVVDGKAERRLPPIDDSGGAARLLAGFGHFTVVGKPRLASVACIPPFFA
jgi:hypothetical protein